MSFHIAALSNWEMFLSIDIYEGSKKIEKFIANVCTVHSGHCTPQLYFGTKCAQSQLACQKKLGEGIYRKLAGGKFHRFSSKIINEHRML